jgi:23S rRNA-/tRNA-specific pseudouridylate synthase
MSASYMYNRLMQPAKIYLKNASWYRSQYVMNEANDNTNKPLPTNEFDSTRDLLFKSKNFLIVNKPYNMPMYNFGKEKLDNLLDRLRDEFPFYYDPRVKGGFRVVHRLDSVTSGCVCLPLTPLSFNITMKAFSTDNVVKHYLALVYGKLQCERDPSLTEFQIDVPIGDDSRDNEFFKCAKMDKRGNKIDYCVKPKNALTKLKILEYGKYKQQECTKVLLQPVTGRQHQLRVHMSYYGYPIIGDLIYGRNDDYDVYRTMLHSYRIQLKINTIERKFLKGKAPDPFLNEIDANWQPETFVNPLNI